MSRCKTKSERNYTKGEYFNWWDLGPLSDPKLIALLDAEGLGEKAKIADDETAMARRNNIIRKFMDEREERRSSRRGVAQRFLEQVQQKERDSKPVVMENVRAAPLKIDVNTWEAPKYKKDSGEKALIKESTGELFLFKGHNTESDATSRSNSTDSGINSNAVSAIIKAFEPVKYEKGNAIVHLGNVDEHLYVVEQGTIEFKNGDDVTVATGCAGTTFGDQNLLYSAPAKNTVVASEPTKVYRLHQETYRGIMEQRYLAKEAKKKERERIKKEKERKLLKAKKSFEAEEEKEDEVWWKDDKNAQLQIAIRKALEKVNQDDLERIRVLGEGQFGEVWLVAANLEVQRKEPKRYEFALKLQETYDEYREETAMQEIRMMKEVSGYPFVSMLYRSYETEQSKDMLLGLIPGGELWETIHKEDKETGEWHSGLSEGHARFYAMVVVDTLEYLHSEAFVFRDLKPENIMLDGWGYPMIVDFGFCKRLPKGRDDKTFTFCGTPNYVAPELILNVGHNGAADIWAMGIVIYEMVSGMNPFFYDGIDNIELFQLIVQDKGEALDEKNHSRQVRKLVENLLMKDPDKRLDAKGILNHAWFEGLSLKHLRKRQIRAPWIPPGGEGETAEYLDDKNDEKEAMRKRREQQVEEELNRRAEEERLRKQIEEEEELRTREEEERLRQEEEERKREERRRLRRERKEEKERRRREEELRRIKEKEVEEERFSEIKEELRRIEEEDERLREKKEKIDEEERRREEKEEELKRQKQEDRRRQKRLEKDEARRRRLEEESQQERLEELQRQQREVAEARSRRIADESESERPVGATRLSDRVSFVPAPDSEPKTRNIEELIAPVPKGIVSKLISDTTRKSMEIAARDQSPGPVDVRSGVKRAIVSKRLSVAKQNEDPANIPSLFSAF